MTLSERIIRPANPLLNAPFDVVAHLREALSARIQSGRWGAALDEYEDFNDDPFDYGDPGEDAKARDTHGPAVAG